MCYHALLDRSLFFPNKTSSSAQACVANGLLCHYAIANFGGPAHFVQLAHAQHDLVASAYYYYYYYYFTTTTIELGTTFYICRRHFILTK